MSMTCSILSILYAWHDIFSMFLKCHCSCLTCEMMFWFHALCQCHVVMLHPTSCNHMTHPNRMSCVMCQVCPISHISYRISHAITYPMFRMTPMEQETTYRVIAKRNAERRKALEEEQQLQQQKEQPKDLWYCPALHHPRHNTLWRTSLVLAQNPMTISQHTRLVSTATHPFWIY